MNRMLTATLIAAGLTIAGLASSAAFADGTNHDPDTGAILCKGAGPCNTLEANCSGKYTDATQKNGQVYGKCEPATAVFRPHARLGFKSR